jgi:hypothetical protein
MEKRRKNLMSLMLLLFTILFYSNAFSQTPLGILCEFQQIPTQGASSVKSFKIAGTTYLAITNRENGSTREVNVSIYKYENSAMQFLDFQSIQTIGASDVEYFDIDGQYFLAISCAGMNSLIYKWNGSEFIYFQPIPSLGAYGVHSFKINGESFLAVADAASNYFSNPQHNINSKIYKWNGTSFSEFQSIATNSAYDWESFSVNGKTYLIVANYFNNSTRLIQSKLYEFNGSSFEEKQLIPTIGAFDWESFSINNQIFLAVANHGNDSGLIAYSTIYKWDANSNSLIPFQNIETKGASSWKSFTINDEFYLAVSNDACCYYSGGVNYNIESKIYKWNGLEFVEHLSVPTHGAQAWEAFVIDNKTYLAVANIYDASYFTDSEIFVFCGNSAPIANAGPNLATTSENQSVISLTGIATDTDYDILQFRWLEGTTVLSDWQYVGLNGEAELRLNSVPAFSIGQHTLTLEIDDGKIVSKDDMILTISNSAPHPAPAGGGTYEVFAPVILSGQVADFDGDLLNYQWLDDNLLISIGQIQAVYGGDPVNLAGLTASFNTVGAKDITLQVSDGVNAPVSKSINVNVIDTAAPTLAPIPSKTILWPPNHQMVGITIQANASDNSGNPVSLSASVASNEPIEGLGDGDAAPDWAQPVIDQQTGEISLQLRAERSGSGSGRIYTISITATDQSGNASTADVKIIVPHDNRKK